MMAIVVMKKNHLLIRNHQRSVIYIMRNKIRIFLVIKIFLGLATDLTLDKYLSQNTSEDNVSFEVIMDEASKKDESRVHRAWLFDQEKNAKEVRLFILIYSFKSYIALFYIEK